MNAINNLDILLVDFKANLDFIRKKNNGEIHIAYSGGKDSTILLNMVRLLKNSSDKLFIDVYAENFYPEIASFIQKQRKYGESTGEIWSFNYTDNNIWKIWKKYGWFGHSKFLMRRIADLKMFIKHKKGEIKINFKNNKTVDEKINEIHNLFKKWGLEHIFIDILNNNKKIANWSWRKEWNEGCCNKIKESTKIKDCWTLTGMRAQESGRKKIYCVDKQKKRLNIMKNWTDEHEKEAIKKYNIEICDIYKYVNRTGCVFCPFAGNKVFNFCCERYGNKLSDEQKLILNDMKEARQYFKPRYEKQ